MKRLCLSKLKSYSQLMMLILCMVVFSTAVSAQNSSEDVARGFVKDSEGDPVIGAIVRVEGTQSAAATDYDGKFELVMPDVQKPVIKISYLGMATLTFPYKKGEYIEAVLEYDNTLATVVVETGIFKKAKESYTGAATTFTAKELRAAGNRSAINTLQNLDPSFMIRDNLAFGSDPNALPGISIRGQSSMPVGVRDVQETAAVQAKANMPLFILNGFEISLERFNDLDQNQIESITILKDASASAMYGSRGANGVVVINTALPQVGKLRITYKGDLNIEAPRMGEYNLMNSREKLEFERLSGLYEAEDAKKQLSLNNLYNARKSEVERGVDTYWLKYPIRTGVGTRHGINIDGGDKNMLYAAHVRYNNSEGVMKGSSRNTIDGGLSLIYNYGNFSFQENFEIVSTDSRESPYGGLSQYAMLNSYYTPYDADGNLTKIFEQDQHKIYSGVSTAQSSKVYNPLHNQQTPGFKKSTYTEFTNNFSIDWKIREDLTLNGKFSFTKRTDRSDEYIAMTNTKFDSYREEDLNRRGQYFYGTGEEQKVEGKLTAFYQKTFADKHNIMAGIMADISEIKSENYNIRAEGISMPSLDFLGSANSYEKDGHPLGSESVVRKVGLTGYATYTFDGKYIAEFNGKYDGSSQFGSENHFAPFWSVSGRWNMHNEKFISENTKVIDRLAFKVSYGISGTQNFQPYLSMRTYKDYGGQNSEGWVGAYIMALGNSDLKWQKKSKLNVGTEIDLFKQRFKMTLDLYKDITDNLLLDVNLPTSSGFNKYMANVGEVQNKGFDLMTSVAILDMPAQSFRWRVGVLASHNKNKVLKISNAIEAMNDALSDEKQINPGVKFQEGESINTIFAVESKGIDPATGKELFIDRFGKETFVWDERDEVSQGSTDPTLFGNINTSVRFKDFYFTTFFSYRLGGYMYNHALANKVENIQPYNNADKRALYDRWQKPGDVAKYKSIKDTNASSTQRTSRFVSKNNLFEAMTVQLEYQIPTSWAKKYVYFEFLSVTGTAENLFQWTSTKAERGYDYPYSRKFSISLTARL